MSAATLMRQRPVLVFDLDGTLVDSAGDIEQTLSLALADCGLDPCAAAGLVDLHSPLETIVRGVLGGPDAPAGQADAVITAYGRRLARSRYERSAPYPGVAQFLWDAVRRGQRLAVCTNKRHTEALRMLAHFGLMKFFGPVVGADSADHPKPHPAPLDRVLDTLRADAAEAVLIGDTHVDAQCARNAGVDFVWHRRGYGQAQVATLPMAGSFDTFGELLGQGAPVPC